MAKIEKLKNGNYTTRVVVGHEADGKPIRKRFTHYDKAKLMMMVAIYEDSHRSIIRRQTVDESIDAFLAAKFAVLSPSTLKAYKSMAKTLKCDYGRLCASYVDAVTAPDMQAVVNQMIANGKTPKTIRNYHGFLSAVWKYAGFALPVATLPQKERPGINIPDEQTVREILQAAKGTRLEVPLSLAALGLRRSEICALAVDDLDGETLHIHRAAVYDPDGHLQTKTTKTYASDRYIELPKATAKAIKKQGYIWNETPVALSDCFQRLLVRHGFPHYRLHDFRHFFVSYCHNVLHLSDAQIQAITGHKTSVVMRANYLHPLNQKEAAQKVTDSFSQIV